MYTHLCLSPTQPAPPYRWATYIRELDAHDKTTLAVAIEEIAQSDNKPIAGVWEVLVAPSGGWENWGATVEARIVQGWGQWLGGRSEARQLVARARILCGLGADQGRLHVMPSPWQTARYEQKRRESIRLKQWVGLD